MLPRQYRSRYLVIIALSVLVHLLIVAVLLFNPIAEVKDEKKEKTVTIKLKQASEDQEPKKQEQKKQEPNKQEPKKQEPKKQEPKKQEPKKQEPKKQEPKKQEPKKQEPKKQEPKKQEPKKQEPKKQEPKKQEPKKQEPKKQESKKQEPKKQELKKQEPKKQEPKKHEPKKQEPKKQEPKKQEPKKQEPKKQEPKKQEPKKQEPKKQEPKKQEPKKQVPKSAEEIPDLYQDMMLEEEKPLTAPRRNNKPAVPSQKWGSMQQLDEMQLSRAVVYTGSLSKQDTTRAAAGERLQRGLSPKHQQVFNATLQKAMKAISRHINTPLWDGRKYYGEINFFVDQRGIIEKIVIKKPSGHDGLDQSMIDALLKTYRLPMPNNRKVREAFILTKKLFYYDEGDMKR